MEPRALLFDEPLSNLDAKLRERMRFELIEIQSKLAMQQSPQPTPELIASA
jgi:iron(III) transport system ATP-binding protein